MARKLQNQFKPNTNNDEIMARNLQKEFGYSIPDTKNDEIMARNLQNQFSNNNFENEEEYARKLQNELNQQFN